MVSLNVNQRQNIFLFKIKKNQHISQMELHYIILDNVNNLFTSFHSWGKALRKKKKKQTIKTLPVVGRLKAIANSTFQKWFLPKVSPWKKIIVLAFQKEITFWLVCCDQDYDKCLKISSTFMLFTLSGKLLLDFFSFDFFFLMQKLL